MDNDEQELQVKKDLQNLIRTLTGENLRYEEMFSQKRGIRSCTPRSRVCTRPVIRSASS